MITFQVSDVAKATALKATQPYKEALETLFKKKIEGFPTHQTAIISSEFKHQFIGTVWAAFGSHYPLVLSPDMIWLLIVQGFATHITSNAEKMRDIFVNHAGKETLSVMANHFVKGQNNAWDTIFPQFTAQMEDYLKTDIKATMVTEFSTTTPIEKAVFELTLMEAMSEYFEYKVFSICGIPEITLLGTVEDWEKLLKHTEDLGQYRLEWWIQALRPILQQFVAAAKGSINQGFWQSIFKYASMSGNQKISGWLLQFFPYVEKEIIIENDIQLLQQYQSFSQQGYYSVHKRYKIEEEIIKEIHTCINPSLLYNYQGEITEWSAPFFDVKDFPRGTKATPFVWEHLGTTYQMEFLGGFVGMSQDTTTLALKPEIGWAVAER